MNDMREKLIELIREAFQPCEMYRAMLIADHLIANGVAIPVRCKDCAKEWCYLRQQLGADGFCSAGERKRDTDV